MKKNRIEIEVGRRDKKKWLALREYVATVKAEGVEKFEISRPLNGTGFFFEFADEVIVVTLDSLVKEILKFKAGNPFKEKSEVEK